MLPFDRVGEDGPGEALPIDLRGDELRFVFKGERDFGGGRMTLPLRPDLTTSAGSRIVPVHARINQLFPVSHTVSASQNVLSPRIMSSSSSIVD